MTTKLPIRIQLGMLLAATLSLSACAPTTPHWDSRFGDSVRATTASQVADPGAARNTNPVSGIDGRAASAANAAYEHSFAQPQNGTNGPPAMVNSK